MFCVHKKQLLHSNDKSELWYMTVCDYGKHYEHIFICEQNDFNIIYQRSTINKKIFLPKNI